MPSAGQVATLADLTAGLSAGAAASWLIEAHGATQSKAWAAAVEQAEVMPAVIVED